MIRLRLLIICCGLLLLFPARAASGQTPGCALNALLSEKWRNLPLLRWFNPNHTAEGSVTIDALSITLRVCAPAEKAAEAERVLGVLKTALPRLSEHAGVPYQGSLEREIVLVPVEELPPNVDGLIDVQGDVYLHRGDYTWAVVHEGAHYWANEMNFKHRWMIEGYAEHLTALTMADLGRSDQSPILNTGCEGVVLFWWNYEPPQCGYAVGAAVFHDLAQNVGDKLFVETMRELGQQPKPMTSWDLLVALERSSGKDLTDLMKQRVFPPEAHAQLEQRRSLWQRLRSAQQLAKTLGIELPLQHTDSEIDSLHFDEASRKLDTMLPLLNAAHSVNERCQQLSIECSRPWAALPPDPQAWEPIRLDLIEAHGMLQQYTRLREDAAQLKLDLPPTLAPAVESLNLEVMPRIIRAGQVVQSLTTLESLCKTTATECRDYWLGDWNAEHMDGAAATIMALTTLMTKASLVQGRCDADVLDACQAIWQAALQPGKLTEAQGAVDELEDLLAKAAALESGCGDWDCRSGWRAALNAGGLEGIRLFIDQTQADLGKLEEIADAITSKGSAPLAIFDPILSGGGSTDNPLAEARQAFAQGDVGTALERARSAQRDHQRSVQQRTLGLWLFFLSIGVLVAVWLMLRALRLSRASRPRPASQPPATDDDLLSALLSQQPPGPPNPPKRTN
ncbi:MAG TPA: hypothetical protein VFZ66_21165 [Herpetosiphonaceae bacterium]